MDWFARLFTWPLFRRSVGPSVRRSVDPLTKHQEMTIGLRSVSYMYEYSTGGSCQVKHRWEFVYVGPTAAHVRFDWLRAAAVRRRWTRDKYWASFVRRLMLKENHRTVLLSHTVL
jgi:hypothetical protein